MDHKSAWPQRPQLGQLLSEAGNLSVDQVAARMLQHQPRRPLEPSLAKAFCTELERLQVPNQQEILTHLETKRVIQTATHLTVSEGPTFLATHVMARSGMPENELYVVGAYSGVPFSNTAWSGCLNFSDRHTLAQLIRPASVFWHQLQRDQQNRSLDSQESRISLIPAAMRDGLVYGAPLPSKTKELIADLTPPVGDLVPQGELDSFSHFALKFCQRLNQRVLRTARIVYLDLNALIANYLMEVLGDSSHALTDLLFRPDQRRDIIGDCDRLFVCQVRKGKRLKTISLRLQGDHLVGPGVRFDLEPEVLIKEIDTKTLCPGLLVTFLVLSFLNDFKCLGSFDQFEYLVDLQRFLVQRAWPGLSAETVSCGLTTGRCVDQRGPIYPLDVVLGTPFSMDTNVKFVDWLEPLRSRLAVPPPGFFRAK